ncbi:MAG: hypothetical protein ACREEM_08855 [Blastocatellia bacterium]
MRRTFVIHLHHQSCPASFEGRVEHVDSGRDGRFRSLEELLCFINETLNEAWQAEVEPEVEAEVEPEVGEDEAQSSPSQSWP